MLQAVRRSVLSIVAFGAAACLMSGCQKKPEPPPAPATKAPAKPPEFLPARQPGLWETRVAEEGSEDMPQVLQICLDKLTDQHLGILGTDLSGDRCVKTVSRLSEGGWGLLAECTMGPGISNEYSGSVTGDYALSYSMKLRSQTTGAKLPQMNRVTNYVVESKRIGDCGKDQRPGDVTNDGVRVNLFNMAGMSTPGAETNDTPHAAPDVVD